MAFTLHPSLAAETLLIKELKICNLYLRNTTQFPWLLLIPARDGLKEIFDLPREDFLQAMDEVRTVTEAFSKLTGADKMNVAMLGNITPQLHIHIIARFTTDPAWPNPVWNATSLPLSYEKSEAEEWVKNLGDCLSPL